MSGIEAAFARARGVAGVKEAFMELAAAGAVVFPCDAEKRPHITEWEKLASVSPGQAASWHRQWPDMRIGLPCGPNGIFVIDLDTPKNDGERGGEAEFDELCRPQGYEWRAATLCQRTGSGGLHLFYKMPSGRELRNSIRKLGPCIDTRGAGGFVIIAPSVGRKCVYSWLNDLAIAELPEWLLALLLQDKPANPSRKPLEAFKFSGQHVGPYQNEREQRAYQKALEGEVREVALAQEGGRNEQLNVSAYKLGKYVGAGKLDEAEVYDRLYEAAIASGLSHGEIVKTIRSGLESGKREPREISPHNGSWQSGQEPRSKSEALRSGQTASWQSQANSQEPQEPEQTFEQYQAECNAYALFDGFTDAAIEIAKTSAIPTGFANLDRLLDGGFYPGLYVAGAITSLGKTTFVLQIADAIAMSGHDVLIFSLEMSKYELMSKSLSRISIQEAAKEGQTIRQGRTAREILCGEWCRPEASAEFSKDFYCLLDIYEPLAKRAYIVEGGFTMDVEIICRRVNRHIKLTGNKPVVVVDYLQILAPLSDRYTDKQNVDRSVVELKRLSRDCKLPVIAVSSFNRESYTVRASMAAFKESGAIEYTSDVLIALQLAGLKDKPTEQDIVDAKNRYPREIELAVIKNRHGQCGDARFKYYPKFNLFEEAS
ncbi:MAG: hypothetical protein HDQ88_03545 [Clostridia bacterium]|nr:hypothetical protein [Clostridia bacterium]